MPTDDTDTIDVRKLITIHAVPQGPLDGWVHTHGMDTLGLPELEARWIPQYLTIPTARLLNQIADYMLNAERPVRLGHEMWIEGYGTVRFCKLEPLPEPGLADHWAVERWAISDDAVQPCDVCRAKEIVAMQCEHELGG